MLSVYLGCVPLTDKGDYNAWFVHVMDLTMILQAGLEKVERQLTWKF